MFNPTNAPMTNYLLVLPTDTYYYDTLPTTITYYIYLLLPNITYYYLLLPTITDYYLLLLPSIAYYYEYLLLLTGIGDKTNKHCEQECHSDNIGSGTNY